MTVKFSERTYIIDEVCHFRKTKEKHGGLSNMASGFPIYINKTPIRSSEALYQACRFPHLPNVQEQIIAEKSPMTAKMKMKPFKNDSRPDWEEVKVDIMRWCLKVKLAQNYFEFGKVLLETHDNPIVEDSSKDDFWGAKKLKEKDKVFKGVNALGRLLMELRQAFFENMFAEEIFVVKPPPLKNFKLLGEDISIIDERTKFIQKLSEKLKARETQTFFRDISSSTASVESTPKKTKSKKKNRETKNEYQTELPF